MKKLRTVLPFTRTISNLPQTNVCHTKLCKGSIIRDVQTPSTSRHYSIFNDLEPEDGFYNEEETQSGIEKSSVLDKLLLEAQEIENVPTRTEIMDYMKQHSIRFHDSEYRRFIRTDCLECGASQTNLISTIDGQMTCTACDTTQPFLNYKKKVTVRKTETTKDDETTTREEKEIEETLRRMESPDNFDSDLYDNVSYLNLMSKYNQMNNKKKDRHLRVRDEQSAADPIGLLPSICNNYDPDVASHDGADGKSLLRDGNKTKREKSVTWIDLDDFFILPEPEEVPYDSDSDSDIVFRNYPIRQVYEKYEADFDESATEAEESQTIDSELDEEVGDTDRQTESSGDELNFFNTEDYDRPIGDVYHRTEGSFDSFDDGFCTTSSDAPSPRAALGANSSEDGGMASVPYQPDPQIKYLWNDSVDIGDMIGLEMNDMMQLRIMLGVERISTDTLSRYNVRGHIDGYDQPAVLYPRYRGIASRLRIPSGLKVIRKIGPKMEKENYPTQDETLPRPKFSGIFGYHMVTASDRMVVLTTNERDALAVYEATDGALAFALPQGERVDSSVFPYLEDFDQIYLWFPIRHLDYAKEWGSALNASRCFLVKVPDRPIEMVRNNRNTEVKQSITSRSVRMRDKGFRSMTDIREEVKADLIHSSSRQHGLAQWKRFSSLNKYLLGFRPGELTVLTGGTGFGKTTFLCEYALDLFTQGVRTLFCSFEMPEEKILKWMLIQYAALPLYRVEYSSAIDSWLDKFERTKGPLTILKTDEFLMNKNITDIAKAISQHVINNGCQHVVIDNLQFLVNQTTMADDSSSGFEKFHHQDRFVGLMRKMATDHQVHVTMVVHPRKTDTDTDLDIQHFGGSARVTQEADNVLAIQRRRDDKDRAKFRKFLFILKNRYGGRKIESDQLEMVFQPGTYSHTLIDHSRN